LTFGGRLQTQLNTTSIDDVEGSELIIRRARLELEAKINDLITLVIEPDFAGDERSEEHTSELQSRENLVCRLLLEKKNTSVLISKKGNISFTCKNTSTAHKAGYSVLCRISAINPSVFSSPRTLYLQNAPVTQPRSF